MRNSWQQILISKIVFPVREIFFLEKLRHIQQTNKMQQTPHIPSAEEWGWGLCDASRQAWWRPAETCRLLPIECCSLSRGCVFLTASFAFKLATMELCDQLTTIQKEAWLYEGRNYNTWQTANSLSRSWSTAVQEAELVLAPPVTSSCWAVTLELVILNILLLFSVTLPMFSRKFSLGGLLALTLLGDKTASASSLSTISSGKWQLHCLTSRVVTSLSSNLYSYLSSRGGSRQETWPYSSCTQLLSGVWYQCSSNKPKNWQRC